MAQQIDLTAKKTGKGIAQLIGPFDFQDFIRSVKPFSYYKGQEREALNACLKAVENSDCDMYKAKISDYNSSKTVIINFWIKKQ